jgi:ketosteroid isomerase-like protein
MAANDDQPSARHLLERFFAAAATEDAAGFGALFAVDGSLEVPAAKLRFTGPAAIADRARAAWASSPLVPRHFEIGELIESATGLTAEYVVHGSVRGTARQFSVSAIAVLDVDGGAIISMREYLQPVALRAVGSLPGQCEAA